MAQTNLPTKEDHNYSFYRENFKRVIEDHIRKIGLYKSNHPGYKIVFFVMDESSSYCQLCDKKVDIKEGDKAKVKPHLHFFDKAFTNVFIESEIDYLIWFSPFKYFRTVQGFLDLPHAVVFDIHNMNFDEFDYVSDNMVSLEL